MNHRLALAFAGAALVACTAKEQQPNDSAMAAAATPNVVTFTASDFAFQAPDTIPAGVTAMNLVIQGSGFHHAQLIRFDEGKGLADFTAAMKAGGPLPTWAVMMGGPNPPAPGETSTITQTLEPGNYAVVCFVDVPDHVPHIMKGMSKSFVVVPGSSAATEPVSDVTMQLTDYAFTPTVPLTTGRHGIRIENNAQQPHELFLAKLDSGKTLQDFLKWGEKFQGRPPVKAMGGLAFIRPAGHAFMDVDLQAGDYILVCFVPDAKDGKPHFMHGMATQFNVG